MNAVNVQTVGCPLGPDLLKSWERLSLENSNSYTSPGLSESADEETEVERDDLIQQLKKLTFDDVSYSKCSTKISEINSDKKDNSENLIFLENKGNEKNQTSSLSLKNKELLKFTVEADVKYGFSTLSNKNCEINSQKKNDPEKLIFLDQLEIKESQFSSSPFKNNKILNDSYKSTSDTSVDDESDSDNDEIEESVILRERYPNRHNRHQNNKQQRAIPFSQNPSKTYKQHLYTNNFQASANYHSTWNNFNVSQDSYEYLNQNHSTGSDIYNRAFPSCVINSEYMTEDAFEGIDVRTATDKIVNGVIPCTITDQIVNGVIPFEITDQIVNDVISYDMTDQIVNGVIPIEIMDQIEKDVISYDGTDHIVNGVIPLEITDQMVNDVFSYDMTDQVGNSVIPCAESEPIVDSIIPSEMTVQVANGVIPYTAVNKVFDSVVSTAGDIGNLNTKFSAEMNDVSYFDHLTVKIYPESIERSSAVTNECSYLDSQLEDLPAEKVNYIIGKLIESNPDAFPSQNHLNIINDSNVATTSTESSCPKSNLNNFGSESNGLHSYFSNTNVEETSLNSNSNKENGILEKPDAFHSYECSANKSSNYSKMVSKNFTSINRDCLSPETSDYNNVSEEIDIFISRKHEIVQWDEIKDWVMKGQKNVPELSPPVTNTSWNSLPFADLDPKSLSKCINTPECELSDKNKGSKGKQCNRASKSICIDEKLSDEKKVSKSKWFNRASKSTCKVEEPKICRIWGTAARDELFHSADFCIRKWELENEQMRHQIQNGEIGTEQKKIIHFLKKNRTTKYKGTNLHYAILSENTEKVFCIVELHKEIHGTTYEINLRDSNKKTVLDYFKKEEKPSIWKKYILLIKYLEENDAKNACRITVST